MTLPNFIVIGAPKCATTSLHAYLATHPQIFMSQQKELHFFLDKPWGGWKLGLDWYREQFEEGREYSLRGESSPGYSIDGFTADVVEKMAALLPEAKLVYMLREPLARTRSHYTEELYNHHIPPDLSLQQILAAGPDEPGILGDNYRSMVYTSLYHKQLSLYLQHYSLEQIYFMTMETLQDQPLEALRGLFRFLEVDEDFVPPNLSEKLNEKASKRLRVINPTALVRNLPGYEIVSRALPRNLKGLYRRAISREIDYNALMQISEEHEVQLRELFAPDMAALRAVTGQSFVEWNL